VSDRRTPLIRPLTGAALGLSLFGASTLGVAATSTICEPDGGYVVAYYNGTFTAPEDADAQRAALRIARVGKYDKAKWPGDGIEKIDTGAGKSEPVRFETFYSTAGKASGATESRYQALAGEYRKLLDGALTQNWEYFWDMTAGNTQAWSVLAAKSADSRFLAVTSAFPTTVTSLATAAKTALQTELDNSTTTLAARQMARAQALYTERQKLLMVSYAEGKLFANKAFAKLGVTDSSVYKQELSALPAATLQSAMTTNMASLTMPVTAANQGFFTATVSWSVPAAALTKLADGSDQRNDFDLHVVEPTNTHVYYGAAVDNKGGGTTPEEREGDAGKLDQDSSTTGPEHYYASCDEVGTTTFVRNSTQRTRQLREGVYQVTVAQQSVAIPAQSYVTLQIAFAKSGEVFSKTWNALTAKDPKSDACPTCNGEVPGFTTVQALKPQVKVKVTKIADGNWKAELVE
jgi:hypothetical protein